MTPCARQRSPYPGPSPTILPGLQRSTCQTEPFESFPWPCCASLSHAHPNLLEPGNHHPFPSRWIVPPSPPRPERPRAQSSCQSFRSAASEILSHSPSMVFLQGSIRFLGGSSTSNLAAPSHSASPSRPTYRPATTC